MSDEDVNTEARRDFIIKSAATLASGAFVGLAFARDASAQRPVALNPAAKSVMMNPQAKSVMPNGAQMDRKAILQQLGLNPNTPADAWLAVIACGSNAAALTADRQQVLMKKGVINKKMIQGR